MSKIIVDQIQAPNSLPINIPATSANSYISHTTSGSIEVASLPRTREIQYNYADTGTGVSSVDIPLIVSTKKIVSLRIDGSYSASALNSSNVFKMDLLDSSNLSVITASSVNMAAQRIRTNESDATLTGTLTSQSYFGLFSHGTSNGNVHQFRGTLVFKPDNSEFYAHFWQNARESTHSVSQVSDATGTLTAFPDTLRIYFESSNSDASRISITPTYEP